MSLKGGRAIRISMWCWHVILYLLILEWLVAWPFEVVVQPTWRGGAFLMATHHGSVFIRLARNEDFHPGCDFMFRYAPGPASDRTLDPQCPQRIGRFLGFVFVESGTPSYYTSDWWDVRVLVPAWAVGSVVGYAVYIVIRDERRRFLRRYRCRNGLCAYCGYDLRATPERCPECGRKAGSRDGT